MSRLHGYNVAKVAETIADMIAEHIENPDSLEGEFESAFETYFEDDELTEEQLNQLYDAVRNAIDEDAIIEPFAEAQDYYSNPLKYYGMSERDFL